MSPQHEHARRHTRTCAHTHTCTAHAHGHTHTQVWSMPLSEPSLAPFRNARRAKKIKDIVLVRLVPCQKFLKNAPESGGSMKHEALQTLQPPHSIRCPAFAKLFSKSLCCCRVWSLLQQFKEQIAPFPYDRIIKALSYYPNASWHKHVSMRDLRLVQMPDRARRFATVSLLVAGAVVPNFGSKALFGSMNSSSSWLPGNRGRRRVVPGDMADCGVCSLM